MRSSKAMAADQIVFHSPELCSELLEVELNKEDSVKDRSADKVGIVRTHIRAGYYIEISPIIQVPSCPSRPSPTRLPSRSSAAAQMTRIQDWLSRKARRAVVVCLVILQIACSAHFSPSPLLGSTR